MKSKKPKFSILVLMCALVLSAGCPVVAIAQAGPPYDVCNNKAAVSIDVTVYVSRLGTVSTWNTNILPTTCVTIPVIHFTSVGHVSGQQDCEVEVVVVQTNNSPFTCAGGHEPICSSAAPSGFPCSTSCPPPMSPPSKCCSCYAAPGVPVISMAWTTTQTDIW